MTFAEANTCFHISLICDMEQWELSKIGILILYNKHKLVPVSIINEEKSEKSMPLKINPR